MTTPWRGTSANDLHRGGVRGGDSKNGDLLLVTSGGHQGAFHVYPNLVSQPPQRGDPQKPLDGAMNQLVARFPRLYAESGPGRPVRAPSLDARYHAGLEGRQCEHAPGEEERKTDGRGVAPSFSHWWEDEEACERRILEFPLDMGAREVAKELKREGWYAWASSYDGIVFQIKRVRAKAGT